MENWRKPEAGLILCEFGVCKNEQVSAQWIPPAAW